MTVLVTGGSGFVGAAVSHRLRKRGYAVRRTARTARGDGFVPTGSIGPETDWTAALEGIDSVIHLAARVHVMKETQRDAAAAFRRVNSESTARLAEQAAQMGVRRLVFLSSIKVNGEITALGHPFTASDSPRPEDDYAVSKWEAEQALARIVGATRLETVVVRPPLVYGPGVKANFLRLLHWVDRGVPLPLASVDNRRSLVGLRNLVDLIIRCLEHPNAAGQTFLVSDGEDLATPELIRRLAAYMRRPARLFPFPPNLMSAGGRILGREAIVERLCGSLQVDITKAREVLGWTPPHTVDEELARTVEWYRNFNRRGKT